MTKLALLALVLAGCTADEQPTPDLPSPSETMWVDSIHAGDMFVLVPGTDSYDYLGVVVDKSKDAVPLLDVRTDKRVNDDGVVFEQAIAAAHRAGIPNSMLEDGTITFGIWGVDFATTHDSFTYRSFEGLEIPIHILGGASKCSHGSVAANLLNYNADNALADATDIYTRTNAWLAAHPSPAPRNVILASHSWGGAGSEYLMQELDAIEAKNGPLSNAKIALTVAMGVPGFVLGYTFKGPGLRFVADGLLYEVDRPDDPVHALHAGEPGGGHQYDITFGDEFMGSYGITTDQMSCESVPGPCAQD